jgi:MinD-like ATPase involved in chromosome partitioning or flagellar assembly
VQNALEGAQAKIAELAANDPEAAKTYVAQVQEFVNANKEQILAIVGEDAAAQTLVSTLVDAPAEAVINVLTAGQSVVDTAENLKDSVEQAINNKAEEVKQGAEDAVKEAVDAQVDAAKKQAASKVNEATQKANEKVNEAAEKTNKEMKDAANKALKSIGL